MGEDRFDRMTLFPVFHNGESPLRYRVLSEALADGAVEIRGGPRQRCLSCGW